MAVRSVERRDVVRFRFRRQELHREPGALPRATDVALLDYGVQDTGPDGAAWALAVRGAPPAGADDLAFAWTLRGAPHAYRRADLEAVATATAPVSAADAAKRIFDAAKPLKAAGIPPLEALGVVADHLRGIVADGPVVKGEVSSRLTAELDEPFLRWCRPCAATHIYEQPFRLAALQAGLELRPGTSPPELSPVPGMQPPRYRRLGDAAVPRFDVVRNHLRFYGPARARDVAAFLDSPVADVKAHWPDDAVAVEVVDDPEPRSRDPRFLLADDVAALGDEPASSPPAVRLLGPYDPYLQLRDRELLVAELERRKDLWRVLGRPGAVVADGEVVGTWRPRMSGRRLAVRLDAWEPLPPPVRTLVEEQAEALAVHRDVVLAGVVEE